VSILLGSGNGTFTASGSPIAVGASPELVAVADLNGDGTPDLAIANTASNTVSILLGNGNGTFTQASGSPIVVGSGPESVVVGDLNGDRKPDLAVANYTSGTVSILLGNGNGTFASSGSPVSVGSSPQSIALGDLNGDGTPDLAATNRLASTVSILLGNGDGTFAPASGSPITVANAPLSVAVGDLNGDGAPDLAVADYGSNAVSILLNSSQPAVGLTPSSLAFPPEQLGSVSPSQAITVSNTGAAPLVVSGVSAAGQDANAFKLSGDGCSDTTVPVGGSCTVGVQFAPVTAGPASAQLRVSSNAPGGPTLVGLSGSALPSPTPGLSFGTVPDPLFATGVNSGGQLGTGGASDSSVPVGVSGGMSRFVAAAASATHSIGLGADGTVWAWGTNNEGELGNGSTVEARAPVQVPAPSGMVAIAAGRAHSLAVRSDGTVWAWGYARDGELGNGSGTTSDIPVQAQGLTGAVAVAAGDFHSLALRSDGTVWAWGLNSYGQLGCPLGTTCGSSTVPVRVQNLPVSVVAIAAGADHSLALGSDGTVWAWGNNADGELGNGCTIGTSCANSSTPVPVQGLSGVVAIAAGANHNLALLPNGSVKSWGSNSNGQLGNNSIAASSTPVSVSGLSSGVVQIAGGLASSYALTSGGELWAWGQNNYGQLGTGNTTEQHVPKQAQVGHGGEALAAGPTASHLLLIGQPHLTRSATKLTFTAPPAESASTSLTETVTNDGLVPLSIGQASIVGSQGDEFVIAGDSCTNTIIKRNSTCAIAVRMTPKATSPAESSIIATLRIPSNSPTTPDQVTLDPPASARAHPAAVSCQMARVKRGGVTVRCAVARGFKHGKHRYTIRLGHRGRTVSSARSRSTAGRTITLILRLPHGLARGRYALTIATTHPATTIRQAISLPRVYGLRR